MTTTRMSEFEVALRREGRALGSNGAVLVRPYEGHIGPPGRPGERWLAILDDDREDVGFDSREAAIAWCVQREEGGR